MQVPRLAVARLPGFAAGNKHYGVEARFLCSIHGHIHDCQSLREHNACDWVSNARSCRWLFSYRPRPTLLAFQCGQPLVATEQLPPLRRWADSSHNPETVGKDRLRRVRHVAASYLFVTPIPGTSNPIDWVISPPLAPPSSNSQAASVDDTRSMPSNVLDWPVLGPSRKESEHCDFECE